MLANLFKMHKPNPKNRRFVQQFNRAVFLPGAGLPPQINWDKAVTHIVEHDQMFPAHATNQAELAPDAGISPRRLSRHSSRQPGQSTELERTVPTAISVPTASVVGYPSNQATSSSNDLGDGRSEATVGTTHVAQHLVAPGSTGTQYPPLVGEPATDNVAGTAALSFKTPALEVPGQNGSGEAGHTTPPVSVVPETNDMDVTEERVREGSSVMVGSDAGAEDGQAIREGKRKAVGEPEQGLSDDVVPEEKVAATGKKTKRRRKNQPKSDAMVADDAEDAVKAIESPPQDLTQPWLVYHSTAPGASPLKAWATEGNDRCRKCQDRRHNVCWTVEALSCEACRLAKLKCDHSLNKTAASKPPASSSRKSRTASAPPPNALSTAENGTETTGTAALNVPVAFISHPQTTGAPAPDTIPTSKITLDVVAPGQADDPPFWHIGSKGPAGPPSSILDEPVQDRVSRLESYTLQIGGVLRERNQQLKDIGEQLDSLKTFVMQKLGSDNNV